MVVRKRNPLVGCGYLINRIKLFKGGILRRLIIKTYRFLYSELFAQQLQTVVFLYYSKHRIKLINLSTGWRVIIKKDKKLSFILC